jgi:hypothetical protein
VKAAAPIAFGGTAARAIQRLAFGSAREMALFADPDPISATDFAQRFFQAGPTDIYQILTDIDGRVGGINSQTGSQACLTQAPVSYDLTPFGETVAMYGQCYQQLGDKGFVQWGVKDGATYLYVQVGAGNLAAIVTPGASGSNAVKAWGTVGNAGIYNTNGTNETNWDSIGSYGVYALTADPATKKLEMVAAGTGLGYCGAHFVTDGTNIFGEGSADMGETCVAKAPICVLASDGTTPASGDCSVGTANYTLTSIGRKAAHSPDSASLTAGPPNGTWGESTYPTVTNITLDGTDTDSLSFGPKTPTSGVGEFK